MKLSEIKEILQREHVQLTKSLGQNFLHDSNQLRRIVAAAGIKQDDHVLEIGPGLGPLTELLLKAGAQVLAIEKDRRLADILGRRLRSPALHVVVDDALGYLRRESRDWLRWKVISNLPYSVASPVLVDLAELPSPPERIVVTLQLEVVKRLLACPGTGDYGLLTLLVEFTYEPHDWFKIPPSCFFPEPAIDSACITLVRRSPSLLESQFRDTFRRIVKRSFSQRRKIMFKLLKADWPVDKLESAFIRLPLSRQARAETVSLQKFGALTKLLVEDQIESRALSNE